MSGLFFGYFKENLQLKLFMRINHLVRFLRVGGTARSIVLLHMQTIPRDGVGESGRGIEGVVTDLHAVVKR